MTSQLNIKTEEAHRLAAELAALTGESLTLAVTRALRQRLDAEQRERDLGLLRARLARLAGEIRATLRPARVAAHEGAREAAWGDRAPDGGRG